MNDGAAKFRNVQIAHLHRHDVSIGINARPSHCQERDSGQNECPGQQSDRERNDFAVALVFHAAFHLALEACSMGISRVKAAPLPGPSLCTLSEPPSSRAASAPLCRPKPWPSLRVVKP